MRIFVDADAFPNANRDVLIRASVRLKVPLCLVANKSLRGWGKGGVSFVQVPAGADVADDHIVELVQPGDMVITADIPLADRVIARGAFALDPRGKLFTQENIKDSLAMRDLFRDLRELGMIEGGPATFGKTDRQAFANQLDRILTMQLGIEKRARVVKKTG
jgi:uncharacterized protein YaiI (UPF0178 family)